MTDIQFRTPRPAHDNETSFPKWRYMYDIYSKEGREHMGQRDFNNALISFNSALEAKPGDHSILIARSHCYLEMGKRLRALRDAETVLHNDAMNPEALNAKAETLYRSGNYELSMIYFHRGLKQQPGSKEFQAGIHKSQVAALEFGGGNTRRQRMSAAGDLSLYTRRKRLDKDGWNQVYGVGTEGTTPLSDRTHDRSWRGSSDDFRPQLYRPLARITKKPGLSHFRSMGGSSERCSSELSHPSTEQQTTVDEESLRQILGELYTDRKYLQRLHTSLDRETTITDLAENGINFLHERGAYWDKLGPLPPPQPKRRVYQRNKGSSTSKTTSVYSLQTNENTSFRIGFKSRQEVIPTPAEISFQFETYIPDDESSVAMETASNGTRRSVNLLMGSEPSMTSFEDNQKETKKRDLNLHVATQLDAIEKLYNQGRFSDCQECAGSCLQEVEALEEGEITDKLGNLARLHSYLGNTTAAIGQFSLAEYHHSEDLEIGENEDMTDVTSRALGNLGRVYMSQGKYNKALDILSRKAPLCSKPREVAWIFLEIGTCFMALGHHDYARDCGKKVLSVSCDPDLEIQRFQAQLLVASAQEKLKHYESACDSYRLALETAKQTDDRMAEYAIKRAIKKLERKLAFSRKRVNQGKETRTPRDVVFYENGTMSVTNTTSKDDKQDDQPADEGDSRNTDMSGDTGAVLDLHHDAGNSDNQVPNSESEWEYEGASVMAVMQRLRDDHGSNSSYPMSEYQESVEEVEELPQGPDPPQHNEHSVKRRPSVTRRPSFLRKGSNAQFDRRISFKLWEEGSSLFEDEEDDACGSTYRENESSRSGRKKSNREKAAIAIKQKSMQIRYQHLDIEWTLADIDTSRYALNGNVVAAAIAEMGYHDLVKLGPRVMKNDDETDTSRYPQEYTDCRFLEILDGNVVAATIAESGYHDFVEFEPAPLKVGGDSLPRTDHNTQEAGAEPETTQESGDTNERETDVANYLSESLITNDIFEEASDTDDEIANLFISESDETDDNDDDFVEDNRYHAREHAIAAASFLYPHENVAFTCPFVKAFTVKEEDILMVSADKVSVEEIEPGSGGTRRFSIVIADISKGADDSDALLQVDKGDDAQCDTLPTSNMTKTKNRKGKIKDKKLNTLAKIPSEESLDAILLSKMNKAEDQSVIKTSEIPPFIRKKNLMFKCSKKDDKFVFTPIELSEQDSSKWKVVFMRIRKGQRQFTVPVAQEQPTLQKNQIKTRSTNQDKQRQKKYPIRLGSKKQFKDRMASTLGSVPEGRESKANTRTRRVSKRSKEAVLPVSGGSDRNLAKLFDDGRIDGKRQYGPNQRKGPNRQAKDSGQAGANDTDSGQSSAKQSDSGQASAKHSVSDDNSYKLRVPRGQEVVYSKKERDGKMVLVPVVKAASHKVVLVKVKQKDKSFVLPLIVKKR